LSLPKGSVSISAAIFSKERKILGVLGGLSRN
jgi:hypothetical protein